MRVLSLFDGISCGQVALERAGIPVEVYYASEIDKYAIQITQKNYPDTIQLGDINNIDFTEFIGKVDLLIGGSPCQDLSISKNNRQGLLGSRSGLFYKYVEALETIKPKYFLLENVASMKKEDKDTITSILGVEPILINSALVSAQQRKRLYWTNIPNITQPQDKGILLRDILESGLPYLEKAEALTASYNGAVFWNSIQKHQRTMIAEPIRIGQYGKGGQGQRIYSVQGKSVSLSANGGGQGAKTGLYKIDLPDGEYLIRKLTPLECERLQTLPEVKNCVIIDFEEESISWFLDHQNINAQFAEKKCHKLQKLVGNAEKLDLNEFVQFVEKSLNTKSQQTKELVTLNVRINCEELSKAKDFQEKSKKSVNIAEKNLKFLLQKIMQDFALTIVGQNLIQKNETVLGREELLPNEKNFVLVNCGKKELSKCGKEIMQLVKDAENDTLTTKKLMKFTTLYPFQKKNIEQNLIIFYYFVQLVISGFTQKPIKNKIILEIYNGYTKYGLTTTDEVVDISATQRYKAIGNGWTVDVIAHIFSFIGDKND